MPACDLLREKLQKKAMQEIEKTEQNREELLKKPGSMLIGNLAVGKDFPMRVLGEIVDAALMDKETIQQTTQNNSSSWRRHYRRWHGRRRIQPEDAKRIVEALSKLSMCQ